MGRYYCCMPACSNYTGKVGIFGRTVQLYKLPTNHSLRRSWIMAISRKNWSPTNYTRTCSDHFVDGIGPDRKHNDKIPTEYLALKKPGTATPSRKPPMDRSTKSCDTVSGVDMTQQNQITLNIETMHTYSKDLPDETNETMDTIIEDHHTCSIAAQTDHANQQDKSSFLCQPEICIEDIQHSDDSILFYTGLQNSKMFKALYDTLLEYGMKEDICESKRKLRLVDELLMVLMRLRLGLLVKDLEYRFKISSSSESRIFNKWILIMRTAMESMVFLPSLDTLKQRVPTCFQDFSNTRIILDCTEIFIQTPSSLENKSQTYSHYKSHNTFKALVGVTMTGAVSLISKLYGGSASDVEITRESGLLEKLEPGDAVMVDKGFFHLKNYLDKKHVKLYCPPFKNNNHLIKEEVEMTKRIASARIHVERRMEHIKNFRILQGVMPLAISPVAEDISFVCGALTNLLPSLVT